MAVREVQAGTLIVKFRGNEPCRSCRVSVCLLQSAPCLPPRTSTFLVQSTNFLHSVCSLAPWCIQASTRLRTRKCAGTRASRTTPRTRRTAPVQRYRATQLQRFRKDHSHQPILFLAAEATTNRGASGAAHLLGLPAQLTLLL